MPRIEEPPVFALVGDTPLAEIVRLNPHRARGVRVLAKLEGNNPGGSVKDRAALAMIRAGLASGALGEGKTLIDATSGNTGIAYATLCAPLGLPVRLLLPANAGLARVAAMRALGAEVVLTDPLEGQDGAIDEVRRLVAAEPERWFYPDQYANLENPRAHETTTAPEIWRQTGGQVTHFVAGLGTSGTAMGTTRGLRRLAPAIRAYGVEPEGPMHGVEGLKHMATSHVPAIYRREELDGVLSVDSKRAVDLAARLAREEGLPVGTSSGAALAGALEVAAQAAQGSVVVTVFPDRADRYLAR